MTKTELRQLIAKHHQLVLLNQLPASFNFPYLDKPIDLKGVMALFDFVNVQIDGLSKLNVNNIAFLSNSISYFTNVSRKLDEFCNRILNAEDDRSIHNYWNHVQVQISNYSNLYPFLYNSPEVQFLLDINATFPNSHSTAFQFLSKQSLDSLENHDNLIGFQKAYAFKYGNDNRKGDKSNAHSISFIELQNQYNQFIADNESATVNSIKRLNDLEKNLNNSANERLKDFDELINNSNSKFFVLEKETVDNFNALKKSYDELLSIEAPAEYWQKRAIALRKEGHFMMKFLIGVMVLACLMLFSLLWISPETMLASFYNGDKSAAVRWSIIFITLLSFFAIGIRALMKATFSALHLARDAEERVSLTYVYLAMSKETTIKDADRLLVMQSLFSRADTGLLKEDSSPSMPGVGGIVEKMTK